MDAELLRRIDADPEVRERGRSVFIRSAIEMYLRARQRREIDEQFRKAYAGHADEMLAEISDLMEPRHGRQSEPRRDLASAPAASGQAPPGRGHQPALSDTSPPYGDRGPGDVHRACTPAEVPVGVEEGLKQASCRQPVHHDKCGVMTSDRQSTPCSADVAGLGIAASFT